MSQLSSKDVLRLLMRSRHRVAAAAWLVSHDTQASEDIFQNVVVKALTKEVAFDSEEGLVAWALVAARREAIDWTRKRQRESSVLSEHVWRLLDREWAAETVRSDETVEALHACFKSLPRRSKKLLQLRYFEGLKCSEVAECLGVSLDAVYQRLSRVHLALRRCIESRLNIAMKGTQS